MQFRCPKLILHNLQPGDISLDMRLQEGALQYLITTYSRKFIRRGRTTDDPEQKIFECVSTLPFSMGIKRKFAPHYPPSYLNLLFIYIESIFQMEGIFTPFVPGILLKYTKNRTSPRIKSLITETVMTHGS